jgi:hypothetical protein
MRNEQQLKHHWLRMKLVGTVANRDAIGAWVEVKRGDEIMRRQVMPTRSYLSQCELPVTFGLGDRASFDSVTIQWPDGTRQEVKDVEVDKLNTIEQPK